MQNQFLQKMLSAYMEDAAQKLKSGNCELSDSQASYCIDLIVTETLSKEQACDFLRVSRATFDNYVRDGLLPKGRKQKGFKELSWRKSDLILFSSKFNS